MGCLFGLGFRSIRYLAILAALLATVACDEKVASPTPQGNQTQIVTVIVGSQPSPNASPSPGSGSCTPGVVEFVRVNPFGYDGCPGTPPPNSSGLLPAGCTARVTATPKDRNGADVPASLHGQNIIWAVTIGADKILVTDDPEQPFNKNVQMRSGSAPGEFQLTATVCSVTGAWNGRTVVP